MIRKWLAIGIILLFVGVTIAPTINFNTVKASQDNDLVEVNTQAYGIQGYDDTTVKLTSQQYQNLQQYLVEFRARLNLTSTREEAILIFKEAVVELDTYGLVPRGMSVQQVQRLITGEYLNKIMLRLWEKSNDNHCAVPGHLSNRFCLIAGRATNCHIASPLLISNGLLGYWLLLCSIYKILPVNLFGKIFFGTGWEVLGGTSGWNASEGEIFTFGAFGYDTLNGDFLIGNIRTFRFPMFIPGHYYYYLGVRGFSGLQLYSKASSLRYFFGWCLEVNVTSEIVEMMHI